jgi:2-polyprenyl-3-methyl-5-hydroxy-6-metoxy-1,4-benzoquinol methylase
MISRPIRPAEETMTDEHLSEVDVARYWDDNAASWATQVRRGEDVAREWLNNPAFLPFIGDLRGRRVLDAGCGEGYNTRILARAGARMTGVDISERMIDLAREAERDEPLGIRYVSTSYAELGAFEECEFDAVVSFMALMDGPRFDDAMKACFRVLRPGGMLAFSLMHPCFITKGSHWIRDEAGVKEKWVVSHYFDPGHWVERWRFTDAPADVPPFAVPRFDRTLSQYLNAVMDAGFVLRRIQEPRPSEAYCQVHPSQRGWRDHAAIFLHVRAERPV